MGLWVWIYRFLSLAWVCEPNPTWPQVLNADYLLSQGRVHACHFTLSENRHHSKLLSRAKQSSDQAMHPTLPQQGLVYSWVIAVLTLAPPFCSCPRESMSLFRSCSTILVLLFLFRFLLPLLFALLVASIWFISWFHWCLVETPKRTSSSSSKFGMLAIESLKLLVSL